MLSRFDISLNFWIKELRIKDAVIANVRIFLVLHTNIQIDVTDFSTLSIVLGRNTYSLLETGLSSDSDVERTWHMLCYGPFKKNSLSLDQ